MNRRQLKRRIKAICTEHVALCLAMDRLEQRKQKLMRESMRLWKKLDAATSGSERKP